jgi:hypothetical protein
MTSPRDTRRRYDFRRAVTVPTLHADNAALRDRVEAQNPR